MPVIDHEALSPLRRKGFVFWFSRCAVGLWRGPFAYKAQALTAFLFTVVLLALATQYRMNVWYRDFFNALERKDGTALVDQVLIFVPLALASIALMILGVWGRMTLQRKWREWLSRHLIEQWLTNGRYRSLALVNDNQNPEYRIAEDVRVSTEAPVDLVFGLATGKPLNFEPTPGYVGSLLYLAILGSVVTFACYLTLQGRIGAARAGYIGVMTPIIALIVSFFFEKFALGWLTVFGITLSVLGNAVILRGKSEPKGDATA